MSTQEHPEEFATSRNRVRYDRRAQLLDVLPVGGGEGAALDVAALEEAPPEEVAIAAAIFRELAVNLETVLATGAPTRVSGVAWRHDPVRLVP